MPTFLGLSEVFTIATGPGIRSTIMSFEAFLFSFSSKLATFLVFSFSSLLSSLRLLSLESVFVEARLASRISWSSTCRNSFFTFWNS